MAYVLGLDLGTSSLKGILVNEAGEVVESLSSSYPLIQEKSGYNEQNPDEWVRACAEVLQSFTEAVPDFQQELLGISFSGQMHSLVVTDADNHPIRPAILWNDVRNSVQCQQITADYGEDLLAITHNKAIEGFTLPKILWLQEEEPANWARVRHIMLPKDYLRQWLTSKSHTDYSDAAGTLLLDMAQKEWSDEILGRYTIPREYLPDLVDAGDYVGDVRPELAQRFGFTQSVKVFAGGADNACSAVGSGILQDDVALASIGTSGVFLSKETALHNDYQGKLHFFNHAMRDSFYAMGVTLAAGYSLDWYKETFAEDMAYDELIEQTKLIPAGAHGLLFTPYLTGERTPYFDSKIRGSFVGIDARHGRADFTKAVLEGITFSLRDAKRLMEAESGKSFHTIVSVGGGAKSKVWQQLQADIFNVPVVTLTAEEGPGFGAAMLAAVGVNWFSDLRACSQQFIHYTDAVHPNPATVARYNDLYPLYTKVYQATAELSADLAAFREE